VRLEKCLQQCGENPPDNPLSELIWYATGVILLCKAHKLVSDYPAFIY